MRYYRHITANDVQLDPFPFKRELSMEAYLIDNENVLALDDDTFSNVEIVGAEISLKETSANGDGRLDILATYSQEYAAIIELKIGQINKESLKQLEGYLKQRQQLLTEKYKFFDKETMKNPKWIGVLVGSDIDENLASKIREGHYSLDCKIPIAALTIKRYRGSDGSIIVTTDTYFNTPKDKDNTKYKLNGRIYGKGRLVHAAIKAHIESDPDITYAMLQHRFPDKLQGSSGVIRTLSEAEKIRSDTGYKRHFMNADEIIQLNDGPIAVSSQWGKDNIDGFINQAVSLGLIIETIR